jgi:hypothetical protein
MVSKQKLVFDTTDVDTIAASDSVGAYLRASDGTLLTHSDVGGKKALDVSIADGVNVEVDLSHVDDSVRLGDGTDFFTSTTVGADIGLDVNIINASIEVTATDLDIRDLTQTDEITAFQGGTWSVDVANTVTVQATDFDIRDISHVSDSIQIGDGTDLLAVNADGSINAIVSGTDIDIRDLDAAQDSVQSNLFDGAGTALTSTLVGASQALDVNVVASEELTVNDAALANTAIASAANALATANTAQNVVASPLADRKYLFVMNNSNKNIFVGASGVTAANGFPLSPSAVMELRAGAAIDIEFVAQTAGQEVRTLELS